MPKSRAELLIVPLRTQNCFILSSRGWVPWLGVAFFSFAVAMQTRTASAQEALRSSLAGQAAVEAKKQALANQVYNVEWGPISLKLQTSLETAATDNVRLTRTNRQDDLSFRPSVNLLSVWRVSEKNQLSLTVGGGYTKYLHATDYDNWFLAPNSDLSFDVYVGDFLINLHDRFSYSQEVDMDPSVSGVGSISRFQNLSGVDVTWDLNKAKFSVGYDHSIYVSQEEEYSYQDYAAELFSSRASFELNPTLITGVELGGGIKNRKEDVLNDNQHVSGGPFVFTQLSQYSQVRASVGYVAYFFDSNATSTNQSTADAFYADVAFKQRVNSWLSHTLTVGRQLQSGDYSDTIDTFYVRYDAQWGIFRYANVNSFLSYERVEQEGQLEELANRYGFGLSLSRTLTEHLSGRLDYQFYLRDSDIDQDYLQNRLVLDLIYSF